MKEKDVLDRAVVFAVEAHSGMTRKGTYLPYIVHPLEAAAIAATLTQDREIMAAAVLHDTVEDTEATLEDIRSLFGDRVAALVAGDTENKREDRPAADTWQIRKQETLDALATASPDEQIIVLADKLSNIRAIYRDYGTLGDAVWDRFHQKDKRMHAWYYRGVADRLTALIDTPAYREYVAYLERVFD